MNKPSIGRVVIFCQPASDPPGARGTNGTREHPAIITRVWSEDCVNLQVLFDGQMVEARTSVPRMPNEAELAEGRAPADWGWRWPDRV